MRKALIEYARGGRAGLQDVATAAIPKLDPHRDAGAAPGVRQQPSP